MHLLEAFNLLCKMGLFGGWADTCTRIRGTNHLQKAHEAEGLRSYCARIDGRDVSLRRAGVQNLWVERIRPAPTGSDPNFPGCATSDPSWKQSLIGFKQLRVINSSWGDTYILNPKLWPWWCSTRIPASPSQPQEGNWAVCKHFLRVTMPMSFQQSAFVPAALIRN